VSRSIKEVPSSVVFMASLNYFIRLVCNFPAKSKSAKYYSTALSRFSFSGNPNIFKKLFCASVLETLVPSSLYQLTKTGNGLPLKYFSKSL